MLFKIILLGIVPVVFVGIYLLASSAFFLETAQYEVSMKESDFEVRDYGELAVVTASMRSAEGNSAFRKLFQFIQGENARQEKISMTTPVFVDGGKMSFVVPDETLQKGVPDPTGEDVFLEDRAAIRVAAYRFSGHANDASRREALAALKNWMAEKGLEFEGEAFFAYYDAPFVPGSFRRNEVMLRLRP